MQAELEVKVNAIIARIQKDKQPLNAKMITEVANPQYMELLELDDKVRVHAELETFPEKLIRSKAPNQTDAELNYIKDSYQAETLPLWQMALSNTNRIFNPQNHSIQWTDPEHEKYFTVDYPNYSSIISYFDSVVRAKKINYPNSVLTVKPSKIPLTEKEIDGEKVYKIDATKMLEPVAVIYDTAQVIYYEATEGCIILLNEKSDVLYNDKVVNEGLVFEVYDRNGIYRIYQTGKKIDWNFDSILYFGHDMDYLPCWQLGGQKKAKENSFIHVSHFYEAVPTLNQVVFDSCMLNASKAANVYLEKYEHVSKCSNVECNHGKVPDYDNEDPMAKTDCPNCKGTGIEPRNGVLGVYQIPIPERFDSPYQVPSPPAGYIDKNSAILEFLRSEIEKNEAKSFRFLGIDVSNSEVKGNETALGKMIDKEALEASIRVIAMELFDLLENTIYAIGNMRYKDFKAPVVNKPTTFAVRTYQSIATEMETLKNAPELVKRAMNLEFMKSRFSSSSELTTIYNLIAAADVLQNKAEVDINAAIATGRVAKWRGLLHDNIYQYIDRAVATVAGFHEKFIVDKVKILEDMAKEELKTEYSSPLDAESIIAGMAGDNVETPVDIEAEAKAKLKGTVGGIQGILEIQKSVSEGLTDKSAAIAMLIEIYGFSEELADKVLGTPVRKVTDAAPKIFS